MCWDPSLDQGLNCLFWALLRRSSNLKFLSELFPISLVEELLKLTEKTTSKTPLVIQRRTSLKCPICPTASIFLFPQPSALFNHLFCVCLNSSISTVFVENTGSTPWFLFHQAFFPFIPSAVTILNQKLEHSNFRTRWFSNLLQLRNTLLEVNVLYKTVTLQKAFLSTNTVLILLRNLEKHTKHVFFFSLKIILLEFSPDCFMLKLPFLLQLLLPHLEQTPCKQEPRCWLWKKSFRKSVWSFLLVPPRLSLCEHSAAWLKTPHRYLYKPMSELCG